MFQKIKRFIVVGITGLAIAVPGLIPVLASSTVSAVPLASSAGGNISNGLCIGINSATTSSASGAPSGTKCDSGSGANTGSLTTAAREIINIFSIIVGIAAVIMIIVGGFRYVTSGGASDKVGGAKNTLIYAIIGLIIVALAQAIVHFVLYQSTSAVSST